MSHLPGMERQRCLPLTCNIEDGLSTEYQRHHCECLQRADVEVQQESSGRKTRNAEQQIDHPHNDAGRSQAADFPDTSASETAETLSVDDDMARKSPVTIIRTMSMGVRMAWPVIIKPVARNSTWTTLCTIDLNV